MERAFGALKHVPGYNIALDAFQEGSPALLSADPRVSSYQNMERAFGALKHAVPGYNIALNRFREGSRTLLFANPRIS